MGAWLGPEHGWVDLDPTNDLVVRDEHVVLAWGRDYGDISPVRGVILGGGKHTLGGGRSGAGDGDGRREGKGARKARLCPGPQNDPEPGLSQRGMRRRHRNFLTALTQPAKRNGFQGATAPWRVQGRALVFLPSRRACASHCGIDACVTQGRHVPMSYVDTGSAAWRARDGARDHPLGDLPERADRPGCRARSSTIAGARGAMSSRRRSISWHCALAALGALLILRAWFRQWGTEIAVTDRRVIYKSGVISRRTVEMNIDQIESVEVHQSIIGRMLGYGDIAVHGTGEGIENIRLVADPLTVRSAITAR